ncbi:MAG: Rpn family recombination-promoting nuclease/putative transposase [Fibrobacter sp.]|nr:Rpn family recombination-promoting nuclease/putative transposase [Fibrobacter sp.]
MNKSTTNKHTREIPAELIGQVYLDPKYDPAFKELFDSEDTLKDFLDAVLNLEGDDKIKTINFSFDKTINFRTPQRKKVILDIFATTGSGRFLDIEMQKAEHDYFIDRAILYKAFLIIKGKQEMERSPEFKKLSKVERESRRYELPESIAIWLCDFDLPGHETSISDESKSKEGAPYMDEWHLSSRNSIESGHPVSIFPKNKYIIISLPNFKKSAKDVQGALDAWLYLLNHASDGTELPTFGNSAVEDALKRIRVENADEELLTAQVKDMVTKEENETRLASALLKGRALEKRDLAKALLAEGDSVEKVARCTGLTPEEIKAL